MESNWQWIEESGVFVNVQDDQNTMSPEDMATWNAKLLAALMMEENEDSITTTVGNCARCGNDHVDIVFRQFTSPVMSSDDIEFSHYALCPTNGEPILMYVTEKEQE